MVVGGGSALSMSAANAQEKPLGQITGSIGATQFAQECVALDAGLYQSAYSETENAVFVTRSVGRPPVTESTLTKVDADSLKVVDSVDPAVNDEASGARNAVYGVDVDDANGLVWTTNTRDSTVAVYDASGLVYVSNRAANNITVYDAATFEQVGDLPAGPNAELGQTPNHVSVDGKGNAFSVNKFAPEEGEGAGKNQLCRITPDGGPLGSVTGSLDQLTGSFEGISEQAPEEDAPAEDAPAE